MNEEIQREALENIQLIRDLIVSSKQELYTHGGGWIAMVWGIYCYIGFSVNRWLIPRGIWESIWWIGLSLAGILATIFIIKTGSRRHFQEKSNKSLRWFFRYWIPFLILAYTLSFFVLFTPGLSESYITVFILLVISTAYIILGLLFFREILAMGIIGYIGSLVSALFFLQYSDIILNVLFGTGLIFTGLVINKKWRYR